MCCCKKWHKIVTCRVRKESFQITFCFVFLSKITVCRAKWHFLVPWEKVQHKTKPLGQRESRREERLDRLYARRYTKSVILYTLCNLSMNTFSVSWLPSFCVRPSEFFIISVWIEPCLDITKGILCVLQFISRILNLVNLSPVK